MARQRKVTPEEFDAAIARIMRRGPVDPNRITNEQVLKEIGGGSKSSTAPLLRAWKDLQAAASAARATPTAVNGDRTLPKPLADALEQSEKAFHALHTQLVSVCDTILADERRRSDCVLAAEKARTDAALADAREQLHGVGQDFDALSDEAAANEDELDAVLADRDRLAVKLAQMEGDAVRERRRADEMAELLDMRTEALLSVQRDFRQLMEIGEAARHDRDAEIDRLRQAESDAKVGETRAQAEAGLLRSMLAERTAEIERLREQLEAAVRAEAVSRAPQVRTHDTAWPNGKRRAGSRTRPDPAGAETDGPPPESTAEVAAADL